MGIRGLTTFIENRSHLYMQDYELHDTNLVIDGNSIACQLYKWNTKSHDCFGGDYDQYGKSIDDFFNLLGSCNITPYVIFDGGYESRKIATVVSRMKSKVKSASSLNPATEGSVSVFPLFLRKVFEDVVTKRGVNKVRCDFESDTETANIARALNCPILSYDSDYFIFDTLYVPFVQVDMNLRKSSKGYKYISCKIYSADRFLKSFTGLDKSSLPVLAVLLGNDYVKRGVFSVFYNNLKVQKCGKGQSDQQKRIKSLLVWLQNESVESALSKVLMRYKKCKRERIMGKINEAIKGYNCIDSKYMVYLNIDNVSKLETNAYKIDNLLLTDEEGEFEDSSDENSEESDECDNEMNLDSNFVHKFRLCSYPACFMDIILHNKYYCVPQVENNMQENSHLICYDILAAIHKILTESDKNLLCFIRKDRDNVGKIFLPNCDIKVPVFTEINTLTLLNKQIIILKILNLNEEFIKCIKLFPKSWHLLLITINYFVSKANPPLPIIYSIFLCKIIQYIDHEIGYYRTYKSFIKKYGSYNKNILTDNLNKSDSIDSCLNQINDVESIYFLKSCIHYFEMDTKLIINHKSFDRDLVHFISQFQSCLLHISYLNSLFDQPFNEVLVSDWLNCTFIYNLTKNLSKRNSIDDYIKILLNNSPIILHTFKLIVNTFKIYVDVNKVEKTGVKKRRKKKKTVNVVEENDTFELDSDEELIYDPNNKFSLLTISG